MSSCHLWCKKSYVTKRVKSKLSAPSNVDREYSFIVVFARNSLTHQKPEFTSSSCACIHASLARTLVLAQLESRIKRVVRSTASQKTDIFAMFRLSSLSRLLLSCTRFANVLPPAPAQATEPSRTDEVHLDVTYFAAEVQTIKQGTPPIKSVLMPVIPRAAFSSKRVLSSMIKVAPEAPPPVGEPVTLAAPDRTASKLCSAPCAHNVLKGKAACTLSQFMMNG